MSQQPNSFMSTDSSSNSRSQDQTYTKEGNAADDSGVVGRGKSVIGGADEALGGTATARLNLDALGRHCDYIVEYAKFMGS